MTATRAQELPFVLFQVDQEVYGLSSRHVREIIAIPPITPIPKVPPEIRGVINLRGRVVKLVDPRVKLGLPPLQAELDALVRLLREREQDHRDWLAELEACIRERRSFALARDPHKCKFGQWYDEFSTRDRLLRMTLPSMDAPHKAIHATADEALRRAEAGDVAGALELIAARRDNELAALIKLFEESRRALIAGCHEVALVLCRGEQWLAFSADRVEAAEHIPGNRIEPAPVLLRGLGRDCQCRVGLRMKTDQTILILDDEFFFGSVAAG